MTLRVFLRIIAQFYPCVYSSRECLTKSSVTSPSQANLEIKYLNTSAPRFSVSTIIDYDCTTFTVFRENVIPRGSFIDSSRRNVSGDET